MKPGYPERIVCLTEEPTEVLYALGEEARIVGISGFTVRPARARREKPKVSSFLSAKIDEILALAPDLVIGFSDIQADIARDLVRAGVEVWISNHRSVAGILSYVRRLGAMVGAATAAEDYARGLEAHSWCGKKFRPERVAARAGWAEVPAVCSGQLHEIKSPLILQPGPAALTDGVAQIHERVREWAES